MTKAIRESSKSRYGECWLKPFGSNIGSTRVRRTGTRWRVHLPLSAHERQPTTARSESANLMQLVRAVVDRRSNSSNFARDLILVAARTGKECPFPRACCRRRVVRQRQGRRCRVATATRSLVLTWQRWAGSGSASCSFGIPQPLNSAPEAACLAGGLALVSEPERSAVSLVSIWIGRLRSCRIVIEYMMLHTWLIFRVQ